MSLNLTTNNARLTVFGYGWDEEVVDSGDADTDEGTALEEYVENNTDYEFPDDFDWDAVAEDLGVELDDDGNIADTDTVDDNLYDLANDMDAIVDYMTDTSESTIAPARIVILNPPDLTEYTDGDTIDYSGIIVAAFTSLTTMTPFINSALEGEVNNLVPFADLTFPVTTATADAQTIPGENIFNIDSFQFSRHSTSFTRTNSTEWTLTSGGNIFIFSDPNDDGKYRPYACSKSSSFEVTNQSGSTCRIHYQSSFTYNEKTAYVYEVGTENNTTLNTYSPPASPAAFSDISEAAWLALYGECAVGTTSIPVQWQTEYQSDPFEDAFDITVTEAEE